MIVRKILKSKGTSITAVPVSEPIQKVAILLYEAEIGAVMVHDETLHPVGILSERDIMRGIAENGASVLDAPAQRLMTTHMITCTPEDHVDELMQVVTENRVRHLPVIERGHLAGIISIGDLVKARINELESEGEALRNYIGTAM